MFLAFSRAYAELFATKTPPCGVNTKLAPLICGGTKGSDIQMIVEEDVEKAMS